MSVVFFGRQQYFLLFPFSSNQATVPGSSETLVQIYPSKSVIFFQMKNVWMLKQVAGLKVTVF